LRTEVDGVFYYLLLELLCLTALRLGSSCSAQMRFSFEHNFATQEYLGPRLGKFSAAVIAVDTP
jgi:hypothetical protein